MLAWHKGKGCIHSHQSSEQDSKEIIFLYFPSEAGVKQNSLEDGIRLRMAITNATKCRPVNTSLTFPQISFAILLVLRQWWNDDFYFYSDCQIEFLAHSLLVFIFNKNADTWLLGLRNFAKLSTILNKGKQWNGALDKKKAVKIVLGDFFNLDWILL